MKKIREIIRLTETSSLSQRQIAKAIQVSRPVVSETIQKYKTTGLSFKEFKETSDSLLNDLLT
ncbi:MAG: IS21 family transposase, partial [Candidatus Scalindua sp.]